MALITLVNTLGNGLFLTTSALFFTRSVGLSAAQLGLALAIAGACGVSAGPPLGWIASRWRPDEVLAAALAAEGMVMLGYLFVHSFATVLPLACVVTFLDRGALGVRNALLAEAFTASERTPARAYLRSVTNVGLSAGAALAVIALQANSRGAYLAMITADAATFLACGVLLIVVRGQLSPALQRPPARDGAGLEESRRPPFLAALADRPYLLITALSGVLMLQAGLLDVGIPLWVVRHTHSPRFVISVILIVNTVMVVFLQVRASRGVGDPARAARACGLAGLLLAVACAIYGRAEGLPAGAAIVVLLAGIVVQTLGEVLSSAAGWALGYDLADQSSQAVYQGIFTTGYNAGTLLAPLAVVSTAIRFGMSGWLILAAVFALGGLAFIPAAAWAVRSRSRGTLSASPR